MLKDRTWGGNLEIKAAEEVYGGRIQIICKKTLRLRSYDHVKSGGAICMLLYSGAHYELLEESLSCTNPNPNPNPNKRSSTDRQRSYGNNDNSRKSYRRNSGHIENKIFCNVLNEKHPSFLYEVNKIQREFQFLKPSEEELKSESGCVVLYTSAFNSPFDYKGVANHEALFHNDVIAVYCNTRIGRFAVGYCKLSLNMKPSPLDKESKVEYMLVCILRGPCHKRKYVIYSLCTFTAHVHSIKIIEEADFFKLYTCDVNSFLPISDAKRLWEVYIKDHKLMFNPERSRGTCHTLPYPASPFSTFLLPFPLHTC